MGFKGLWDRFSDVLGGTILHPQYFMKLIERETLRQVEKNASGTFLDIGCGRQWYRQRLAPLFDKYLALDSPKTAKLYKTDFPIEIKADAVKMPIKKNSIDRAMMIMVLEHLPDPDRALKEILRILRSNGTLFICTVENYPGHDFPYNYYHFTKYGLTEILKRSGFKVKKLTTFGNFWESRVVAQNVFLMRIIKKLIDKKYFIFGFLLLLIFYPIMIIGNLFAYLLGIGGVSEEFALGHIVVAEKT